MLQRTFFAAKKNAPHAGRLGLGDNRSQRRRRKAIAVNPSSAKAQVDGSGTVLLGLRNELIQLVCEKTAVSPASSPKLLFKVTVSASPQICAVLKGHANRPKVALNE